MLYCPTLGVGQIASDAGQLRFVNKKSRPTDFSN
jgi:hypothetical protein